jgi:hypothetical protein
VVGTADDSSAGGARSENTENLWQSGHRMYLEVPNRIAVNEPPGRNS